MLFVSYLVAGSENLNLNISKSVKDKPNELEKLKNTLTNFFQILFKITAILRFKEKKSTQNKTIKSQYKRYYLELLQRHTRSGHFNPPSARQAYGNDR